jgi:hypothetical protein
MRTSDSRASRRRSRPADTIELWFENFRLHEVTLVSIHLFDRHRHHHYR